MLQEKKTKLRKKRKISSSATPGSGICATLPRAATEQTDHAMAAFPFAVAGASETHLRHMPLGSGHEYVPEIEIKLEFSDEEEEERVERQKGGALGLVTAYGEGSHEKRKAELFPEGQGSQSRVTEDWQAPSSVRGMNQALRKGWAARHATPPAFKRTRRRKTTSEVWQFFSPDARDPCRAICILCQASVGRGKLRGHCNTTALTRHLASKHPLEWERRKRAGGRALEQNKEVVEKEELVAKGFPRFGTGRTLGSSTQPLSEVSHSAPRFLSMISESSEEEEEEGHGRASTTDTDFFPESSGEESSESSKAEVLPPQGRGRCRKGRKGRKGNVEQPKLDLTIPHLEMLVGPADPRSRRLSLPNHPLLPLGTKRRRSTSAVWQFFYIDCNNISQAICTLCQASISRGKLGSHLGTSALKRHLEGKHPLEWRQGRAVGASATPRSSTQARRLRGGQAEDEEDEPMDDVILTSPAALDSPKSPCASPGGPMGPVGSSQESKTSAGHKEKALPPSRTHATLTGRGRDASGKYTPSHPRAQAWHRGITELLCGMALPCSFVSAKPFHHFMAQADPRYRVPSPAFFSRKAVPQLCQAIGLGIALELQQAEVCHVHLSAHVWAHGPAGEHLVLAAHWLTPHSAQARHRPCSWRRQAVLCVQALRKEQAVADVQQVLAEQVNLWLAPNSLSPGFLVSGGSPGVERAAKDGGHTHLPCLAHCLSQLVQAFLDHHHSIEGMLGTARAICAHFSCSPEARRGLEELQRQQGLAPRRLKQEATASWDSTYYMLERLQELQPAVQEYVGKHQLDDAGLALSANQWKLLGSMVALLQPFEMAVREASAAHALLSQVLPQVRYLHIFLRQICLHFQSQGGEEAGPAVCLAESLALQLSMDPCLSEMFRRQEYVLATLLDPRFKGTIDAILPPGSDLDHWKKLLVQKVKELMASATGCPSSSRDAQASRASSMDVVQPQEAERGPGQPYGAWGPGRKSSVVLPLIQKEKTLIEHLESVGLLASKDCGASLPTESLSACVMVDRYLCDTQTVGAQDHVLGYWEKRQWLWPALAKLASLYLSCPPSAAFLERIFSAPDSPFSTERRPPDWESLESLVFLRANLGNFPSYPRLPFICSEEDSAGTSSGEERT
uniref:BED-type domain-containing protein n=1 Tax=Pelusios castaneus TaxID=367368 RepID=A0A8C8SGU9_9SAUR